MKPRPRPPTPTPRHGERARRPKPKAIIAKAGTDAEALVARRQAMAEAKIAAEERAAIDELRATAAKAATAAAAKLIAERNDAASDAKLVDQAIAGLGPLGRFVRTDQEKGPGETSGPLLCRCLGLAGLSSGCAARRGR